MSRPTADTPSDQPPASRQGADELDAILVLFSKRLAIVQGEYNASTKLSEVQKHAEEAQDEAKAAIAALIETEALQILDRLTIQATETKDVTTGAIRQTVGLGYILNERRNLAQRQAELEAGSGEAADE